jgi:hypothetical protein
VNNKIIWHGKANLWGYYEFHLTVDQRLFLIVVLSGAIGSFIHSATSFASYVGSREYVGSWTWWYLLRIPIGSLLAISFYCVFRGGFLGAGADTVNVNPYGTAAMASLAGMFSKQAIDKLKEIFDNLFKTDKTDKRKDKMDNSTNQN